MRVAEDLRSFVTDLAVCDPHMTRLSLSAPWGAHNPGSGGHPGLYVMTSGSAFLAVEGEAPVALETGDVAVLPHGSAHVLASRRDARVASVAEVCASASVDGEGNVVGGGGGILAELATLCFRIERPAARAVAAFAPALVVLRAHAVRPWLASVIRATLDAAEEAERERSAITCRLGELIFLEALRGHAPGAAPLGDVAVARAVVLLRSELAETWTAATLARRVGLSRSALYDRFVRQMGCSPGAYLIRARMEEAAILLGSGSASVEEVSARVGYRWPSSFSVAFRRHHGMPPTHFGQKRSTLGPDRS